MNISLVQTKKKQMENKLRCQLNVKIVARVKQCKFEKQW